MKIIETLLIIIACLLSPIFSILGFIFKSRKKVQKIKHATLFDGRGTGRKRPSVLPVGDVNLHDLKCIKCGEKWRVLNPLCPYVCPYCEGQDTQESNESIEEKNNYKCFWCEPGIFELKEIRE